MRTSMILHSARGMVGGSFSLEDCNQEHPASFEHVAAKSNKDGHLKANRMLELLVWDPALEQKYFWTPMSLPINLKGLNSETTDSSFDPEIVNHWYIFSALHIPLCPLISIYKMVFIR